MSILDMDATALVEKIRKGEVSSLQATDTYINHLRKINPSLNCLVEERFERARQEAKEKDEQLTTLRQEGASPQGRLFGVPISMKESFDVADMKTTGGLPYLKDNVVRKDAKIVEKLKVEGAIILGKTNTPALCFCQESDNKLYGRTNNPWDVTRTAGGSSGGEGSLMAAGGAAVGIGSDIGGSIRFPSHFNGVIGFKSGNRQVSQRGSFPDVDIPLQERMLGIGAMAKSVRDARLINEIIADQLPEQKELGTCKITFPLDQLHYPVHSSTFSLLSKVKESLSRNFNVIDEQPPYYKESALLWQLMMSIDGAAGTARHAFGERKVRRTREYVKELFFKSSEIHPYLSWALIGANLFKPNAKQLQHIERTISEGDEQLARYFEDRLLILPVYHTPAPPHGRVYKELFSIRKTYLNYIPFVAYANVWGLPSLVLPVGEGEGGLPIAIQIISRVGNEELIFKLGEELEKNFRGYIRCEMEKVNKKII